LFRSKARDLNRRCVATHDRLESSPRLCLCQGLALHQLGNGVDQLLAPGTLPTGGEGSGEGTVEPEASSTRARVGAKGGVPTGGEGSGEGRPELIAPSTREHRRMKLARIFLPSFVSTDSGWDCTPYVGCFACRSPMTVPSAVQAVTTSSSGIDDRSTISE